MKALLLRLILCGALLLTALISNGQYRKLTRGEKMPYDTGVVVEINRYRMEGLYIKKSRILIDSLNFEAKALTLEIDSLYREIEVKDLIHQNQVQQTAVMTESYNKLSGDVNKLSESFDMLYKEKNKWDWKDWALGALVLILGGATLF